VGAFGVGCGVGWQVINEALEGVIAQAVGPHQGGLRCHHRDPDPLRGKRESPRPSHCSPWALCCWVLCSLALHYAPVATLGAVLILYSPAQYCTAQYLHCAPVCGMQV